MNALRSYGVSFFFFFFLVLGGQMYWGPLPLNPGILFVLIFHCTLYQTSGISPIFLSISGLYLDILWGQPLGLYPFLFLSGYSASYFLREFLARRSFYAIWLAYGTFVLGIFMFSLALHWCGLGAWMQPFYLSLLLSWCLYPLVSKFLMQLTHKRVRRGI